MRIETEILSSLNSLVIWHEIRRDEIIVRLMGLLKGIDEGDNALIIDNYYPLLSTFIEREKWNLKECSWANFLVGLILEDENPFSLYGEKVDYDEIPEYIVEHADRDLNLLRRILCISWEEIAQAAQKTLGYSVEPLFKDSYKDSHEMSFESRFLADHYRMKGSGRFGEFKGFRWRVNSEGHGYLEGIENIDSIELEDLIGCETQKERLIENTELLLSGYSANNVLLYGDKGTGKSSMVKAILNRYYTEGLRIVEVPKDYLENYYDILSLLEDRGLKFIIFIDDLSFEETEPEYKHIKALLEGGLKDKPKNVVIYATSNRRHLIRESFDYRDEITPGDAIQEKLSLSDRFGITLTFMSPSQKEYIDIVKTMARARNLSIDEDTLIETALTWSMRYNGTSGRTARQFIDHLEGSLGMK